MNRKRAVSILAIIMAVVMILSLILSVIPTAHAVTQAEINALQAKKDELTARVQEAQARLDTMQEKEASVLEKKAALEEENAAAKEALELVAEELAMYDQILAEKTLELGQAQAAEEEQGRKYRARIRSMEEDGTYDILALILNSSNFSELLSKLDDMDAIMESDKRLEGQYRAARMELERVKTEYEQVRAECEGKQNSLRAEQAQIEARLMETEAILEELADEIEEATRVFEEERAAEAEAAAEVTALIAEYQAQKRAEEEARRRAAEEAAAAAAAQGQADNSSGAPSEYVAPQPPASTGAFTWPVPCSRRITGRYGESRTGHFHAGIDIDGYGNDGQPVLAAASGTVITATSSGAYGNYVIIDHGNGYTTLYAHMSSNAVGSGAYVNAGDVIGYLGATGNATGTHCHFEVRINGSTTDPAQYFSGLSYWNC